MRHFFCNYCIGLALVWGLAAGNAYAEPFSSTAPRLVEAVGSGLNSEDALKAAFSRAVETAVGVLLDSKTIIENDELLSERILTFSNGYIESYKIVSKSEDNGLVTIRISAEVRNEKLAAKLKSLSIGGVANVDGASLAAQAITKNKAFGDARMMLDAALKDFPASCLEASIGAIRPIPEKDGITLLHIPISIKVNATTYAAFDKAIRRPLQELAKNKKTYSFAATHLNRLIGKKDLFNYDGFAVADGIPLYYVPGVSIHKTHFPELWESGFIREPNHKALDEMKVCGVMLFDGGVARMPQTTWTLYEIDNAYIDLLSSTASREITVYVRLRDKSGGIVSEVVATDRFLNEMDGGKPNKERPLVLDGIRSRGNSERDLVTTNLQLVNPGVLECDYRHIKRLPSTVRVFPIGPIFYYNLWWNGAGCFSPELRFTATASVSIDELARVSRVECVLETKQLSE